VANYVNVVDCTSAETREFGQTDRKALAKQYRALRCTLHVAQISRGVVSVSVSTSRSRRLGLETVSRRTNVLSRSHLEKKCQRLGFVSVSGGSRLGIVSLSAIYVSCPRPIFGHIVQATLVNQVNLNGV